MASKQKAKEKEIEDCYPSKKVPHNVDVDFEQLLREEFLKLSRNYRLMEEVKQNIITSSSEKCGSRSGRLLSLLKAEKEDILADFKNANSYKERDKETIKTILQLLEAYERYLTEIKNCWLAIDEMEANVDKITKRLIEQQLKVQALFGQTMTLAQVEKKKGILENKLYHYTTLYDSLIQKNKESREEIDLLLKERGMFFNRLISLKKRTNIIKQNMAEIILAAAQAYEQRDEWVAKIQSLKEKNDRDSKQHVLELKEFNRVLHHDSKLHLFMSTKNQIRSVLENATQRNERKLTRKIVELNNILNVYIRTFQVIYSMSNNSNNLDKLIEDYQVAEKQNMARFKCIRNLSNEITTLQQNIEEYAKEIEKLHQENEIRVQTRNEILQNLQSKFEEEKGLLEESLEKLSDSEEQMKKFLEVLGKLFQTAECDKDSVYQLMENNEGISSKNAILAMTILEHKITDLIREKQILQIRKKVEIDKEPVPKRRIVKSKNMGGPYKANIIITGRHDADEEDDEEDQDKNFSEGPIEYTEMKKIVHEKIDSGETPMPDIIVDSKSIGGGNPQQDTFSQRSQSVISSRSRTQSFIF